MRNTLDQLPLWRRIAYKLLVHRRQEALVDEFDDLILKKKHTHAIDTLANPATISRLDSSLYTEPWLTHISPEIPPVAVAATDPLKIPRVDGRVWHSGVETLDELLRKPVPSSEQTRTWRLPEHSEQPNLRMLPASQHSGHHQAEQTQAQPTEAKIRMLPASQHSGRDRVEQIQAQPAEAKNRSPITDSQTERFGHHTGTLDYYEHGLSALLPFLIGEDLWGHCFGPLILPHPIYEFQRDGIEFLLATMPGALLADDMGLGKTVQSIVALRMLFHKGEVQNALVVAPKPVLNSWERHFSEWAPEIRVKSLMGTPDVRRTRWRGLAVGDFHVGIITYESLRNDYDNSTSQNISTRRSPSHKQRNSKSYTDELSELPQLGALIADEVQKIKNPSIKATTAMRALVAQRRWGLSGTPLENSIGEFASVLRFVDRNVQDMNPSKKNLEAAERQLLKSHAEHLMLRRRKIQVLDQLPELFTHIEYIELGSKQRQIYDQFERQGVSKLRSEARSITNVLALIHKLKQVCNGTGVSYPKLENSKLEWLKEYLCTAEAEGDKTLVFSQYTNKLPVEMSSMFLLKYQGHMSDDQRRRVIDEFENSSEQHAMLMSLHAASLGLNLQVANRVVHFDSWWNPAVHHQATARVHRIGQKKTVFETTLVTVDTIEERIQQLLDYKRDLFVQFVDDLSVDGVAKLLSLDDMYQLFGL